MVVTSVTAREQSEARVGSGGEAHLDPVLGSFLEIGNDGIVPQVNEPGPEVLNANGTGQKEART